MAVFAVAYLSCACKHMAGCWEDKQYFTRYNHRSIHIMRKHENLFPGNLEKLHWKRKYTWVWSIVQWRYGGDLGKVLWELRVVGHMQEKKAFGPLVAPNVTKCWQKCSGSETLVWWIIGANLEKIGWKLRIVREHTRKKHIWPPSGHKFYPLCNVKGNIYK